MPAPTPTTLLEIVHSLTQRGLPEAEVIRQAADQVNREKVVLRGIYRGQRIRLQ